MPTKKKEETETNPEKREVSWEWQEAMKNSDENTVSVSPSTSVPNSEIESLRREIEELKLQINSSNDSNGELENEETEEETNSDKSVNGSETNFNTDNSGLDFLTNKPEEDHGG